MAPHATGDWPSHDGRMDASMNAEAFHRSADADKLEPVAVVGMSFGFPQGATSSDNFWKILMEKRNTATEFPPERLNVAAMYHPDANRRGQVSFARR